jgi:hypothetical protein
MDAFSARRQEIDRALAERADEFAMTYGRAPSRAELMHLRDTIKVDTRSAKAEPVDWAQSAQQWEAKLGGELAPIAEEATAMRAPDSWREHVPARGVQWESARDVCAQAAQAALARVQAQHATWGRAELMREVSRALPGDARQMDPEASVRLVCDVTERALRGEFGRVVSLDAPEWPALPDYLRRDLDGRSVYTRPGTERFATHVQLSLEQQLIEDAQRHGAPHLAREAAARALGADPDGLDAALRAGAQDVRDGARLETGLRLDQGAAAYHVLTSPRVAEVLVGPAGAGKTYTLGAAARAWRESGRQVIGVATSQQGANELRKAGIEHTLNSSQFLGHLPGQRGARGAIGIPPESLIIIDEASMMSTPDLADIAALTVVGGHKLVIAGDHAQLSAVESGGGMNMLVGQLGHVRLGEVARFSEPWEGPASLRLRAGDLTALEEYADHGRLRGGTPEQVKAAARQQYVSHFVQGTDVELLVWQHELGRELAAAVQDDLRHLGLVDATGPRAAIADGATASAGDIVRAKSNDHRASIANNDLFRVESVNPDGSLTVRRDAGRHPETGQRTWSDETITWRGYRSAELGYSSTAHSAQGRTITVGLPVITGGETREWAYSAMTRGERVNLVHAFTTPRAADPVPGSQPAPEVAEYTRKQAERAGEPVTWPAPDPEADVASPAAVVAGVMERTGTEASALDLQLRNLANADHLAALDAIWHGETAGVLRDRYRQLVAGHLPEGTDLARLDTPQATWLWRTLRQAEAAGMDARAVVQRAVEGRSLEGIRDLPSVIDARIRREAGPMLPTEPVRWSDRVPEVTDPDKQRFLTELAAAMDARVERIGEDAAANERAWAVNGLGPVPEDPLERLEWERRASTIGAYREMYGHSDPAEPCGPEPSAASPEARAAWYGAYWALNRVEADDMSRHQDGTLLRMREQYAREYAWAPAYPAAELEVCRWAVIDQEAQAARSDAEATAARIRGDEDLAARHHDLAVSARAAAAFYAHRVAEDEATLEDRQEWERLTEGTRDLALRADAEYRKRNPEAKLEPLASGELADNTAAQMAGRLPQMTAEAEAAERTALLAADRQRFREEAEARAGVIVPHEDPDYEPLGEAWPTRQTFGRDAVLQPPKPEIRPAESVLEAFAAREAEQEAGLEAGL